MKNLLLKYVLITIGGICFSSQITGSESNLTSNHIAEPLEQSYFKILSLSPNITYIYNFLTDEECDYLISIARPRLETSTVIDSLSNGLKLDSGRTSEGCFLSDHDDPIINNIEKRISALVNIPIENGETLHVLRYEKGEEYKPHYDYFSMNTIGGAAAYERGGQRIATLIMYLYTPEKGGETIFPLVNIKIKPTRKNAVLFYNCTSEENVDPLTLHGGAPVIAGVKWIATKWLHPRPYK